MGARSDLLNRLSLLSQLQLFVTFRDMPSLAANNNTLFFPKKNADKKSGLRYLACTDEQGNKPRAKKQNR